MSRIREVLPAEKVKCIECQAKPWARCTTLSGISRTPHSVRVARSNGLLPTPRNGFYSRPSDAIKYDEDETPLIVGTRKTPLV